MAVGRHRAVHQLGVALGQLLVPQAQLVQRTGAVVFHKHISAVGQLVHHVQTARVAQVDAQALLAHVLLHEVAALAAHHRRAGTASVTGHGTLDLDDVGAHGAQATRHVRPGQKVAVVDDTNTRQGQFLDVFMHEIGL